MLLQCRMREPQEHSQPQLDPQATHGPVWWLIRDSSVRQGLHHGLWHRQLVLQTSPVVAPGQLKPMRTCSLDVKRRDVPRRTHSSSLQSVLWPPPTSQGWATHLSQ